MSDTETLINTLIANGLASSRSEAQRMAESMISTSKKVNESMRQDRDNSMVKDYGEARRAKQAAATPHEQNVEELRQKALNPEPVQVQTEFDTPLNDQKRAAPQTEQPAQDFTQEPVQESPAEPQLTPEFYAAQQMQNMGAQTVSDLTSEPAPIQEEAPVAQANFAEAEPMQQPTLEATAPAQEETQPSLDASAPSDFISQEPAAQPTSEFTQEPIAPVQQEVPQPSFEQQAEPMQQPLQPSLEASAPAQEPVQPTHEQVGSPVQQAPQEAQSNQITSAPSEEPPKKKNTMNEEEKKLAEEVDLSRVFNFSNK